jgi:uncharacterized protein
LPDQAIREFVEEAVDPKIRGFLHLPETRNGNALVLSHGAGSNARAPLLIALAETFATQGFTVLRCDLPYRQLRAWGPPGPGDAARDRAGIRNTVEAMKKMNSGRIFLGGHSYGGRQSSMLLADESGLADGLLLLSYPLHPPRKPEQQRTQHLPNLQTPTLFIQGTRDPFGSISEIEQAMKMIPGKTKLIPVEAAGHDLGFKGKTRHEELLRQVFSEFREFLALSP